MGRKSRFNFPTPNSSVSNNSGYDLPKRHRDDPFRDSVNIVGKHSVLSRDSLASNFKDSENEEDCCCFSANSVTQLFVTSFVLFFLGVCGGIAAAALGSQRCCGAAWSNEDHVSLACSAIYRSCYDVTRSALGVGVTGGTMILIGFIIMGLACHCQHQKRQDKKYREKQLVIKEKEREARISRRERQEREIAKEERERERERDREEREREERKERDLLEMVKLKEEAKKLKKKNAEGLQHCSNYSAADRSPGPGGAIPQAAMPPHFAGLYGPPPGGYSIPVANHLRGGDLSSSNYGHPHGNFGGSSLNHNNNSSLVGHHGHVNEQISSMGQHPPQFGPPPGAIPVSHHHSPGPSHVSPGGPSPYHNTGLNTNFHSNLNSGPPRSAPPPGSAGVYHGSSISPRNYHHHGLASGRGISPRGPAIGQSGGMNQPGGERF